MKIYFISIIMIFSFLNVNAEMLETFNSNLGDISYFETTSNFADLGNNILLFANYNTLITFDYENNRVIDSKKLELTESTYDSVYLFSTITGINNMTKVYIHFGLKSNKIGVVEIDNSGEFQNFKVLPIEFEPKISMQMIVDDINKKIWFFGMKIIVIGANYDSVFEMVYPESWRDYIENGGFHPVLVDGNKYIILSMSYQINDAYFYKYLQINCREQTVKELNFENEADYIFFKWPHHENKSLYYKGGENNIFGFNHETLEIDTICNLGDTEPNLITFAQFSPDGNIAYIPGNSGLMGSISSIGTIDFLSKTFDKKDIQNNPGVFIDRDFFYYSKTNRIFSVVFWSEQFLDGNPYFYQLCEIDLETYEFKLIDNIPVRKVYELFHPEESTKLLLKSNYMEKPRYYIYDYLNNKVQNSIILGTGRETFIDYSPLHTDKLCIFDGYRKEAVLVDDSLYSFKPYYLVDYISSGDRLSYSFEYQYLNLFPELNGLITSIHTGNTLKNLVLYDFEKGNTKTLPIEQTDKFFKDTINNRIVALVNNSQTLEFINSDGTDSSWQFSDGFKVLDFHENTDTNKIWIAALDNNSSKIYFYRTIKSQKEAESFVANHLPFSKFRFIPEKSDNTIFVLASDGTSSYKFIHWSISDDEILFSTDIYTYTTTASSLEPTWAYLRDKDQIFIYDGYGSWLYDADTRTLKYGNNKQDPDTFFGVGIFADYDSNYGKLVIVDLKTQSDQRICEYNTENGSITDTINLPNHYYEDVIFNLSESKISFIEKLDATASSKNRKLDPKIVTVNLDGWENAPTLKPRTNNVEYHPGNNLKLKLTVNNPGPTVNVTAYIWFWLADGTFVCFDGTGISLAPKGITLTLPAGTDVSFDFIEFTMPDGLPQGYWTADALFFNNDTGQRGPISNYNFYYRIPE
jgi:hypothetical protein